MTINKKYTIEDIAKHAGVSIKTVSRVFNNSPQCAPTKTRFGFGCGARFGLPPEYLGASIGQQTQFS
jgi:AraC-like DNA-binding protein